MLMRGGTSKGAFFLADELPEEPRERNDLVLRVLGSPDPRQIDGIGGAHPLTSKAAIVSRAADADADLDYLFLQVGIDAPTVSETQTCGNLLAGVVQFAIERDLIFAGAAETTARVRLRNTGDIARVTVSTPGREVEYDGDTVIDGVPGSGAPVQIALEPRSPLLPTGQGVDVVEGLAATLVDNGMPVVLLRASDLGLTGAESPEDLEADADLRERVEAVRLTAGERLGLGDVREQSIPKVFLLSPPSAGGDVRTRAFIPHRVHPAIGVVMAGSVAAGLRVPGAVGSEFLPPDEPGTESDAPVRLEHPSGVYDSHGGARRDGSGTWRGTSASVRTARKIFDGWVYPAPTREEKVEHG